MHRRALVKAVFVKRDCLVMPGTSEQGIGLRPEVGASLRLLADAHMLVIVLDPVRPTHGGRAESHLADTERMLQLIRGGGGQVHALAQCLHWPGVQCGCWHSRPGFLYAAAAELDLRLDECYVIGNEPEDVHLARRAGCRPVLDLGDRSIADLYGGHQPESHDFPMARSLESAVKYLLCEEEANDLWGFARQPSSALQDEEPDRAEEPPEFSPELRLLTPVPGRGALLLAGVPPLSRRGRSALLAFVLGGVWLSLGIAYMLTHLYRVQHFPAFVWYLTLQFIPRPVRGLLFILSGVVLVGLSLRAFRQVAPDRIQRV
jgi:hypothetical protein